MTPREHDEWTVVGILLQLVILVLLLGLWLR